MWHDDGSAPGLENEDAGLRDIVVRWTERAESIRAGEPFEPFEIAEEFDDVRHAFDVLLRHSFDGVSLNARESRWMLEVSDSFCRLTGYDRSELVGRTSHEVNLVQQDEIDEHIKRQADAGREGLYVRRLRRKNGDMRWVEFSQQLLGPNLVLTILRDVTERFELEDRLRDESAAAEAARRDAEESDRAKAELLGRMREELRLQAEALVQLARWNIGTEERKAIHRISETGGHLVSLIDEMLDS